MLDSKKLKMLYLRVASILLLLFIVKNPSGCLAESVSIGSKKSSQHRQSLTLPKSFLPGTFPTDRSLPIRFSTNHTYNVTDTPAVLLHLVKNSNLKAWLKLQGPGAFLTRRDTVLFLHRRTRRQTPPASPTFSGADNGERPHEITPVLPILGEKSFNGTDCMPWAEVAAIMKARLYPKEKRAYIDQKSCRMDEGLECLPIEEKGTTIYRCKCMLVFGPKAVYTNYTDNTGRVKKSCFVPAGLGWPSECQAKPWNNYGYPLPFGDPSGTNADPAAQIDSFEKKSGEELIVDYIKWNSINTECVPHAECREKGTYRGQRCQCKKGHRLEKPEGKCSGANRIITGILGLPSILILAVMF